MSEEAAAARRLIVLLHINPLDLILLACSPSCLPLLICCSCLLQLFLPLRSFHNVAATYLLPLHAFCYNSAAALFPTHTVTSLYFLSPLIITEQSLNASHRRF